MTWVRIRWNGIASQGRWYWVDFGDSSKKAIDAHMRSEVAERAALNGRASADWEIGTPPPHELVKAINRELENIREAERRIWRYMGELR